MYIISSEKERGWFLLIPTLRMLVGSKRCSSSKEGVGGGYERMQAEERMNGRYEEGVA